VIEPIFNKAADLVILDDNVAFGNELTNHVAASLGSNIDGNRRFSAIAAMIIGRIEIIAVFVIEEWRAPVAGVIAGPGAFDLDNLSAQVREKLVAPGPGQDPGEFDHFYSRKRLHA
jgi:hypothetical protein